MTKSKKEADKQVVKPGSILDNDGMRRYLNKPERIRFYDLTKTLEEPKRLFMQVILFTGARISEALNLEAQSIDLSDGTVIIKTLKKRRKRKKGRKSKGRTRKVTYVEYRHIPVPQFFLRELAMFIQDLAPTEKIWNFPRRSATRYIKKAMTAAGIYGTKACSRGLRHSYAVNSVLHGVALSQLKTWMGHESIETTAIYLKIVGDEERKMAEKMWNHLREPDD